MSGRTKRARGKSGDTILSAVDPNRKIAPEVYFRKLHDLQNRLRQIQQAYIGTADAAVLVFEGWDTAGKGGVIRRITMALDARSVKVFLHISPEEQLRRFEQRLRDPLKRWKLQYEDFRNREKWDAYEEAIEEMLERTSTKHAPWYVIPADNKKYARIDVISRICERLSANVDLSPKPLDEQTLAAARKYFDLDL